MNPDVLCVLELVARNPETNTKINILTNSKSDVLSLVFKFTYNKQINFGIGAKSFPFIAKHEFENVTDIIDTLQFMEHKLLTRSVTGNTAIALFDEILRQGNFRDYEVIRRICNKDLEIGVGITIADKIFDVAPSQPMMLASVEDDDLINDIIASGEAYSELKADGSRSVYDSLTDELISRNGNIYKGLDKLQADLRKNGLDDIVIDGELLYVDKSLSSLTEADRELGNGIVSKSLSGTISEDESDSIVFKVWDLIPRDVYYGLDESKNINNIERRLLLEKFVKSCNSDRIVLIERKKVKSVEEAKADYQSYRNNGYEGTILKNGLALWENKRSKHIVKFKAKIRVDVKITGVYPHKKDINKLGGIMIETADGIVKSDCGSGFTDTTSKKIKGVKIDIPLHERGELDREFLMSNKEKLIDTIAEIECNGLTINKKTKQISFFLPIMKRFRHDKNEANNINEAFSVAEINRVMKK